METIQYWVETYHVDGIVLASDIDTETRGLIRDLLDAYCRWLFDILFTLRERMSGVELDAFQARFYGRVSEIIFNVWLDHQLRSGVLAPEQLREIPCIHMEPVNWWKKGTAFLKAKFFHQRYDSSF